MDIVTFSQSLTSLFYIFSISYIYCSLLTPKGKASSARSLCLLLLSPMFFLCLIDYHYLRYTIGLITALPMVLFCNPWRQRLSCYVISYLLMLINESICYPITSVFFLSAEGFNAHQLAPLDNVPQAVLPTALLIIAMGTLLVKFSITPLKKWFFAAQTGTLALLGLPLVLLTVQQVPLYLNLSTPILSFLLFLAAVLCALIGIRRLKKQEILRNQREKQQELIEKQLFYSGELEKEYRSLRKWNHDIANHFMAISYLLENEKYQEGSDYIKHLLEQQQHTKADTAKSNSQI